MKFLSPRRAQLRLSRRPRKVTEAPPHRDDEAYVLLEEARLRCLRLRDEAVAEPRLAMLAVAYREFGMAGYMASSRIPSERRLRLLAEARERCGRATGTAHPLRALMQLAASAAIAVERALVAPGITDHLQTAAEHLVRARVALGDLLTAGTPAATHAVHG